MLICKYEKHGYFCEEALEVFQQSLVIQLMVQSHAP